MHAKSGLRVLLKWKINRPDSVITAVIRLNRMRTLVAISLLCIFVGCDAARGIRARTAGEIAKVQAGEQHSIVHPLASELFLHVKNEGLTSNLKEISLTGDLAPYTSSQILAFDQITKIDLYCTHNTDQFLALAPKLPNLNELYVGETDATDAGVASASKCKRLIGFGITSWGDTLTMQSINQLANVPTLQQLNLEISSRPNNLSKLRDALPGCKIYETTYAN